MVQSSLGQSSLQDRVNQATAGDTVHVPAGIYDGDILLSKRITVLGVPGVILHGTGRGSVVTVTADSCVIRGITIEHSGPELMNEDSGILLASRGNLIENNVLHDILFGIYLLRSDGNIINRNAITGRKELEIGERGSGIHIFDSYNNRFVGNTITLARDGFYIQNANHTWIEGNSASNLRYGLHYMYADSNTFLRNRFFDNVAGAAVMYSKGIVMRRNVFAHNRGFASYGILFQDCHGVTADSNVIADNVVGLFFEASTGNRFRHNLIALNDVALQMFSNSSGNVFSENNFVDNLSPLRMIGRETGTYWSDNGRGNYWSEYDGYDLDQDGIGDVPMKIQNAFDYLEATHPNLRLYLYSPAAQALASATKAFPIVDINSEEDTHPLMRPVDLHGLDQQPPLHTLSDGMPSLLDAGIIGVVLAGTGAVTAVLLKKKKRS